MDETRVAVIAYGFRSASLNLALSLLCIGCQPHDESSSVAVRDSAGVRIVENSGNNWPDGRGWRLASQPVLDIGASEGDPDYQLFRVVGALRLSDDRIVIANAGTGELLYYESSGRFISKSGGKGSGPGEFQGLTWLGRLGADTLVAFDWRNRRISIFDPNGNFVRSATLDALAPAPPSHVYVGLFSDGSLLVGAQHLFASGTIRTGVYDDTIFHVRFDPRGATYDTIGRQPGARSYVLAHDDGLELMPLPFGRRPRTAAHEDGYYFGRGDSYAIDEYSAEGGLERSIRWSQSNEEVTADDKDRYVQRSLEGIDDEAERRMIENLLANIPYPETMPAYAELHLDSEDHLWVGDYRKPGDESRRFTVFDPDGRMLGRIELPDRFTIHQIGPDFVLGSWTDEMDVEHVKLYALIKPL